MSKRAERKAIERYPITAENGERAFLARGFFVKGYEQGEKDTIERAAEWFRTHWREYIMGPDADGCVGFGYWENDFRKAMEEE